MYTGGFGRRKNGRKKNYFSFKNSNPGLHLREQMTNQLNYTILGDVKAIHNSDISF
jgi:hypothetical protein